MSHNLAICRSKPVRTRKGIQNRVSVSYFENSKDGPNHINVLYSEKLGTSVYDAGSGFVDLIKWYEATRNMPEAQAAYIGFGWGPPSVTGVYWSVTKNDHSSKHIVVTAARRDEERVLESECLRVPPMAKPERRLESTCLCGTPMAKPERCTVSYACGLPYVELEDVDVWTCAKCGERETSLSPILELNRLIARAVVTHARYMGGAEVRFVRKYMGWTLETMAEKLLTPVDRVARWEMGEEAIGPVEAQRLSQIVTLA
jgi:DNA-binding transcriptional regulator YiaG